MRKFTHISRSAIFATLLVATLFSCKKDKTEPVDSYDYYPLEIGRYAIYEVQEEIYSAGQANPVKKSWQEKDETDRMATDENGIPTYTFARSRRNTDKESWQKVKEFTAQKFPDKLLTNIDNQTFFSMAFPVDPNVTWNGNSYNNADAQEYHYENLGKPIQVGSQSFDKALVVVERKDTSIINRYIGIKQYGLGVGLIFDDQTAFELCQTEECIGSGKIESGTHITRKIIEYGIK
ncbi:hypothetical protein [Dyadobacter sp. CY326]|uniref:hypothetical protein n=1 Tax=Dyadobacter sp. CY326 TaxID=2907300 RepID=UPI001F2A1E6E|nr:hypothetical protein [Dyadobacter sp. CY326]MCE7065322.1 hypothetical protein [Dyadobacter sp. CY326]